MAEVSCDESVKGCKICFDNLMIDWMKGGIKLCTQDLDFHRQICSQKSFNIKSFQTCLALKSSVCVPCDACEACVWSHNSSSSVIARVLRWSSVSFTGKNREIHRSWSSTGPMMRISLTEEIEILSPWAGHSYAGAFLTFSLLPRVSDRPIARSLNLWPYASGCGGNNGLLKPATVPPIPDSRLYCSSTSSLSTSSSSVSASFCASYSASSEGAEVIEVGGCGGSRRRRHGDFEGVTGVSWLMVLGGIGVGILDDWRVLISRLRTADSDDIMLAEPGSKNFRHHQSQDLINTLFQRHRSRIKDRIVHP